MKNVLAALGVVVVLGIAGWWFLEPDGGRSALRIDALGPEATSPTLPAAQGGAPLVSEVPAADDGAGARRPASEGTPLEEPAAKARVEVLVVSANTGEPLPGIRVTVHVWPEEPYEYGPYGDLLGGEEHRLTTDARGRASVQVSAGRSGKVQAVRNLDHAVATCPLGPLEPGETFPVRLELPTEPDSSFHGRVIAAESGEPIAGARVRFFTKRRAREDGTGPQVVELRTGPQGRFESPFATWTHGHARVDAEGYGPATFVLDGKHGSRGEELVVELPRGATLLGLVESAATGGVPAAADLVVRAEARAATFSVGFGMSTPSYADLHREVSVSAGGRWQMTDLPPGAGLELTLWRGETRVRSEPGELFLQAGETRELLWTLGGGATIHGRALLADTKEPQVGLDVWLVDAGEVAGLLASYMTPEDRIVTDDAGRFTFDGVRAGEWVVGPAPRRWSSKSYDDDAVAPSATFLSISEDTLSVSVELRVHRGLFISGQVVGLEGEPVHESSVRGYCRELEVQSAAYTDPAGRFRLGPLLPGDYRLTARGGGETSSSDPVTATAGGADVVLRLNPGGTLRGRLVDASTGEAVHGRFEVIHEQDRSGFSSRTREDGSFGGSGMAPGSYTIHGNTDTLAGRLEGVVVVPGAPVEGLEVLLQPGAVLVVRNTGELTDLRCDVTPSTGVTTWGWLEPGQAYRTVWSPDEAVVTVRSRSSLDAEPLMKRTVVLTAGEETVVEFVDG